nr:hypothetical protein [uncultured Duganella sp.]
MDTPSIKDYVDNSVKAVKETVNERISAVREESKAIRDVADVRHEAIVSGVREYYAMTEARLAEMETRLTHKLMDVLKWSVGVMVAGITISASLNTYMQVSTLNQLQTILREVRAAAPASATTSNNR